MLSKSLIYKGFRLVLEGEKNRVVELKITKKSKGDLTFYYNF
jgi:hypothetical protein